MNEGSPADLPDDWSVSFFDDGFAATFGQMGRYDSTADEVDEIASLLGLPPGARILDVPCGFGRHAGPLDACGYEVVGIDMAPAQIEEARRRWPGIEFSVGDMRQPPEGPFDAVLNLWSSFGLLPSAEEDLQALAAWRRVLAPGGSLLMHLTTLERAQLRYRRGDELVSVNTAEVGGVLEETHCDWSTGVI
ncbi:class I SAM-dependent methyltransferase, partial [Streptomyces sp. NPDC058548]